MNAYLSNLEGLARLVSELSTLELQKAEAAQNGAVFGALGQVDELFASIGDIDDETSAAGILRGRVLGALNEAMRVRIAQIEGELARRGVTLPERGTAQAAGVELNFGPGCDADPDLEAPIAGIFESELSIGRADVGGV